MPKDVSDSTLEFGGGIIHQETLMRQISQESEYKE